MNNYVVDPKTIVPFWLRLFLALSASQFELFSETFDFPIKFTDELKDISKEFSLRALSYMDVQLPEPLPPTTVNLGTEISDRYLQLWNYTFSRLAAKGYADALYRWVEQFAEKHRKFINRIDAPSDFDVLLLYWAQDSKDKEFTPLALPQSTLNSIQLIVLRHHIKYQELYIQITKVERRTTGNSWEDFVIKKEGIGSWLINEGLFHLQLSKWNNILSNLSVEEIQILNDWGYNHMTSQYSKEHFFSIVDLAKELSVS